MILKVRAMADEIEQSWRYFDNINGVHWTKFHTRPPKDLPVDGVQYLWFMLPLSWPTEANRDILMVSFFSEATGPVEIWSETEVYLLNDNGKTIERLI